MTAILYIKASFLFRFFERNVENMLTKTPRKLVMIVTIVIVLYLISTLSRKNTTVIDSIIAKKIGIITLIKEYFIS